MLSEELTRLELGFFLFFKYFRASFLVVVTFLWCSSPPFHSRTATYPTLPQHQVHQHHPPSPCLFRLQSDSHHNTFTAHLETERHRLLVLVFSRRYSINLLLLWSGGRGREVGFHVVAWSVKQRAFPCTWCHQLDCSRRFLARVVESTVKQA